MTLEEMLKGIDEFFDGYTPESFCDMLTKDFGIDFEDEKVDTVVGNFDLKQSCEPLWKKWNLDLIPVFKKSDFAEYSRKSSTLCNDNEGVFSEDDGECSGVAA